MPTRVAEWQVVGGFLVESDS